MMTPSATCPICSEGDETLLHCFRDCRKSFSIWSSFNIRSKENFFSIQNWKNWMELNLRNRTYSNEEDNWHLLFGVVLDMIWRTRNNWVFSQKHSTVHSSVILIRNQLNRIVEVQKKMNVLYPNPNLQIGNSRRGWSPPPIGYWKLNSDGSVRNGGREAGCGGVLRDSQGNFVFGFSHKLQSCSIVEAELWGILQGISIACNRGIKKLVIEVDSMEALELLLNVGGDDNREAKVVREILNVGNGLMECEWLSIERELNMVADQLATHSHMIGVSFVLFNFVPDFLVNLLYLDSTGSSCPVLVDF